MKIQTLAASLLALGLLSPVAYAGNGDGYSCSKDTNQNGTYIDCIDKDVKVETQGFSAGAVGEVPRDSIGDFIDETNQEKNQRSNSN